VSDRVELAEPCPDDQKGDDDGNDPVYGRSREYNHHRHEEHCPRSREGFSQQYVNRDGERDVNLSLCAMDEEVSASRR
jgi:hypothetical protein